MDIKLVVSLIMDCYGDDTVWSLVITGSLWASETWYSVPSLGAEPVAMPTSLLCGPALRVSLTPLVPQREG